MAYRQIKIRITTSADTRAIGRLTTQLNNLKTALNGLNSMRVDQGMNNLDRATKRVATNARNLNRDLAGTRQTLDRLSQAKNQAARAANQQAQAQTRLTQSYRQGTMSLTQYQTAARRAVQLNRDLSVASTNVARSTASLAAAQRNHGAVLRSTSSTITQLRSQQALFNTALRDSNSALSQHQGFLRTAEAETRRLRDAQTNLRTAITQVKAAISARGQLGATQQQAQVLADLERRYRQVNELIGRNRQMEERAASALRTSYQNRQQASQALEQYAQRIQRVTQASQNATQAFQRVSQGIRLMQTAITSAQRGLQNLLTIITRLAQALSAQLNRALSAASVAIGRLGTSAASSFARLRAALDSTGRAFLTFGQQAQMGTNQAMTGMTRFAAAGWSLLATGAIIGQSGRRMMGGLTGSLSNYMDFEVEAVRAAIAAETSAPMVAQMVFDIQRGGIAGMPPITQFSPNELATAVYRYSAALGQDITAANYNAYAAAMTPIMQAAAVTLTDPEQMIKGTLNAMMEFGYDPRMMVDTGQTGRIAKTAAQMAYLANISTMEVKDIVEAFKMMGPTLHVLSGAEPGAGLEDAMIATFFASEMGLRGGNVGRGINRLATSLLKPTQQMNRIAREIWGTDIRGAFFDDEGYLEGGIEGVFRKILMTSPEKMPEAARLASMLLTQNASRVAVGVLSEMQRNPERWERELKRLQDEPERWLSEALLTTNNSIFANFQNLKNAWFAVQAGIIAGIEGPLKGAFKGIADVLWEVFNVFRMPEIGPQLASLVTGIAAVAATSIAAVGAVLTFTGTMLLLSRAVAVMGTLFRPILMALAGIPLTLLRLSPIILGVAAALAILRSAWTSDFMGMRTAFGNFMDDFTVETHVVPRIKSMLLWIERAKAAFNEFINGILIGRGSTRNLGAFLGSIFGPLLGASIFGLLHRFSDALEGVRQRFLSFTQSLQGGAGILRDIPRLIQGFFEQVFLGMNSFENWRATQRIGEALGIDDLPGLLRTAASHVATFIAQVGAYFRAMANEIGPTLRAIFTNLGQIFTTANLQRALSAFAAFASGVVAGFSTAIIMAVRAVELLTRALANAGTAGNWIAGYIQQFTGLSLTINGLAQAIGFAIGTYLGSRLVLAIMPGITALTMLMGVMTRVALMGAQFGIMFATIGAQFVLFGARVAATTALLLAQVAVYALVTAATIALTLVKVGLTAAKTAYSLATMVATAATTGMSASLVAAAAAAMPLVAALAALLLVIGGIALAGLGITAFFAGLGAVFLVATAASQGLGAAWQGLLDIISGFMAVMSPVISVVSFVVDQLMRLSNAIAQVVSGGNAFSLIGAGIAAGLLVIASAVGLAVAAVLLLGAALASVAVIMALPFVAAAAAVAGAAYLIGVSISDIKNLMGDLRAVFSDMGWSGVFELMAIEIKLGFKRVEAEAIGSIGNLAKTIRDNVTKAFGNLVTLGKAGDSISEYLSYDGVGTRAAQKVEREIAILEAESISLIHRAHENMGSAAEAGASQVTEAFGTGISEGASGIGSMLESAGVYEEVQGFFSKLGIDIENMADIDWAQAFKLDGFADVFSEMENMSGEGVQAAMREMMRSVDEGYDAYLTEFDNKMQSAWRRNISKWGFDDPEPLGYSEYMKNLIEMEQEGLDAAAAELEAQLNAFQEQVTGAFANLSFADAVTHAFATSGGQISVIGAIAQHADTIIGNIGEAGPWMNEVELMVDAVIAGGISDSILGINMHEALRGPMQHVIEQTGLSFEELVDGIPRFVHDANYIPLAATELIGVLSELPTELVKDLDVLGAGIYEDFGLEWMDVIQFAISNAMEDKDWNFKDYLMEAWSLTPAEADEILRQVGMDAEDISSANFGAIGKAMAEAAGEARVITDEAWEVLGDANKEGSSKIIEITQEAYDNLSREAKIALGQLGFAFRVESDNVAGEINASNAAVSDAIRNYAQNVVDSFEDLYDIPDNVQEVARVIDKETGELTVLLQDLEGRVYRVPAVEYDAFEGSLRDLETLASGWSDNWRAIWENFGIAPTQQELATPVGDATGGALVGAKGAISLETLTGIDFTALARQAEEGSGKIAQGIATGLSSNQEDVTEAVKTVTTTALDDAASTISTNTSVPEAVQEVFTTSVTDIELDTSSITSQFESMGTEAGEAFGSALSDALGPALDAAIASLSGGGAIPGLPGGPSATVGGGTGPFDSAFEGYAQTAVESFKTKLETELPQAVRDAISGPAQQGAAIIPEGQYGGPFDRTFQGYAEAAANSFGDSLSEQLPPKISEALSALGGDVVAGPGAGGVFASTFERYANDAARSFGETLQEALPPQIDLVLASIGPAVGGGDVGVFATAFQQFARSAAESFGTELQPALEESTRIAISSLGAIDTDALNNLFKLFALNAAREFGTGLTEELGVVIPQALTSFSVTADAHSGMTEQFEAMGKSSAFYIGEGIKEGMGEYVPAALTSFSVTADAHAGMEEEFKAMGKGASYHIAAGIQEGMGEYIPQALSGFSIAEEAHGGLVERFENVGKSLAFAIATGIQEGLGEHIGPALTGFEIDTAPFETMATSAAEAFGTQLSTDLATQLSQALEFGTAGGVAGGGPFDATFQGYATSAATAFGEQLNTEMSAKLAEVKTLIEGEFVNQTWTTKFDADPAAFNTELETATSAAQSFADTTFTATINADNSTALSAISTAQRAADSFAKTYTAILRVQDFASATINSVRNNLDSLNGRVSTVTVQTVNQTVNRPGVQALARGGVVKHPFQLVGERGPELTMFPMGTRVFSARETRKMLEDVLNFGGIGERMSVQPIIQQVMVAQQTRPHVSPVSETGYHRSRRWETVAGGGNGRAFNIEIDNVHIHKEADVDKIIEKVDQMIGVRIELARRGMMPADLDRE